VWLIQKGFILGGGGGFESEGVLENGFFIESAMRPYLVFTASSSERWKLARL
jgi:hypothetical protein